MAIKEYQPPKTVREFMLDDAEVKFCIGPLGSGKSTGCIMELARRMVSQQPDEDGIRPTRFAVIRNTLESIKNTCLKDIEEWLGPIMNYKVSAKTIYFDFSLPDGTTVASEWLLIPLDNVEDTRRLLSLQLTGAWIEEFRETDYAIVSAIQGRIGRYPRVARVPCTWVGIIGSSNPFPMGSEWYEHLVLKKPTRWSVFRQPGAFEAGAENREYLREGYYENLMEGHSPDWIDVHVHGKYGPDQSGRAVFYSSFDYEYHTATDLRPNPQSVLVVGLDFGRTPVALFSQHDANGRLVILDECTSEDMGMIQFVQERLRPKLSDPRYSKLRIVCTGDPAGTHKTQVDDITPADVLKSSGLRFIPAGTNNIEARIRAVESLLLENRQGKSALLIDRDRCPTLVRAMASEYKYKKMKTGRIDDKPDKSHPWSDVADALQYISLGVGSNLASRANRRFFAPRSERPRVSAAAWT